jgi:hypothetical protein
MFKVFTLSEFSILGYFWLGICSFPGMSLLFAFLLSLASTFSVLNEHSNRPDTPKIDEISFSFKEGSSSGLARLFDKGIELNINGNQGAYSKAQAELVLRNFFKKNPPENFRIIHQAGNGNQVLYLIGNYLSEDFLYRVLIKSKILEEDFRIYSMDIIRE